MEFQGTLGTSFTYQGQLEKNGEPVSDDCKMAFRLYDAAGTGASQVGSAITTTVLYGCERIASLIEEDSALRREVTSLRQNLYASAK